MGTMKERMKSAKLWTVAILLFLVVLFAVQNRAVHPLKFLVWKFRISLSLTMFLVAAIGFIAGLVFSVKRGQQEK